MITRSKRASSVGIGLAFVLAPPLPDGTLVAGDRKHVAWSYASTATAPVTQPPEVVIPDVVGPTGSLLHVVSDIPMQCPPEYYGGFKDARLERMDFGERVLSDMVTGDPVSATCTFRYLDYDLKLRRALASTNNRYITVDPVSVHMTTRANRAVLGQAYLVFFGYIIDAQPVRQLSWEITLGDVVSRHLLTDRAVHPWRKIGDGFIHEVAPGTLGTRVRLSSALDYHTPEPIIYGQHRRVRDVDPPSQHGFEVDLTDHYLGIWDLDGGEKHVWLVAGHACADLPDVNTVAADGTHNSVIPDEGLTWWIPHQSGWDGIFGAPYVDLHSTSFGNLRRYTLILGAVGSAEPDACAFASGGYPMDPAPEPLRLMAFVDGVESSGAGTNDAIIEYAECYLDWVNNYGCRTGADGYQSGPRLSAPTWMDPFDGERSMVDEDSFRAVGAINLLRFPELEGYPCAAIIGAKAGDIHPATKWMADWNSSGFCASGWTNSGQYRIATPHPTEEAKAAAPLLTDAFEIRQGSFNTVIQWSSQANRIPWQNDPDPPTDRWMGSGIADAGEAISNYDREILGAVREFPFAPGFTMGNHIANLHAWVFKHPPRHIVLEDTVGPDYNGDSLGYLQLGQWIRYQHYAQVGEPGQIRLAWVIAHRPGRRVMVKAWDMEDLLAESFGVPPVIEEPGSSGDVNDVCPLAIIITNGADEPYSINLDTTDHETDPDIAGIAGLPGPAVGYHPAYFRWTAPSDGTLTLTTMHSDYDTQIAVCTGACGSLTLVEDGYNDNDGILTTSALEVAVTLGSEYTIIVYGYGPDDGGVMTFGLLFTADP